MRVGCGYAGTSTPTARRPCEPSRLGRHRICSHLVPVRRGDQRPGSIAVSGAVGEPSLTCSADVSRERPRQDSNLRTRLRRPMLYPLSYEGGGWRILGRKLRSVAGSGGSSRLPSGHHRLNRLMAGPELISCAPNEVSANTVATRAAYAACCVRRRWWRWSARPLTMRA